MSRARGTDSTDHAPLVFITGASSGIGQALAQEYARQGWRLALVARRVDLLRQWAEAQGLSPERCVVYGADVQDTEAMVQIGARCLAEQGLPDVVIANAGISVGIDTAERADLDVLREIHATNVLGMAATFHPFVQTMRRARRGVLVGMASVAAVRGLPGHAGYCSSKAAVVSYCESLRAELRGDGVRVVTLLPGFVDTPLTRRNPYRMPFLLTPEAFAQRACRAIQSGAVYRVIPWPMAWVAFLMRCVPRGWWDVWMGGRPRKPRRT